MYMTYRESDHGNYTKVFDHSQYSADLPETVDWRTSNAVTGIKYQVFMYYSMCIIIIAVHELLWDEKGSYMYMHVSWDLGMPLSVE